MPLTFLNERLSVPSRLLGEPGPDAGQLQQLLQAAIRVPDHGQLHPWRLLLIRGDARQRLGDILAEVHARKDSEVKASALEKDRNRFNAAPLIVAVIARITPEHKIPEIEQMMSAGCVAHNLLLGAQALGFGAQWLTAWAAYDAEVTAALGLVENEHLVAFVHIGTPQQPAREHARVALDEVLAEWNP